MITSTQVFETAICVTHWQHFRTTLNQTTWSTIVWIVQKNDWYHYLLCCLCLSTGCPTCWNPVCNLWNNQGLLVWPRTSTPLEITRRHAFILRVIAFNDNKLELKTRGSWSEDFIPETSRYSNCPFGYLIPTDKNSSYCFVFFKKQLIFKVAVKLCCFPFGKCGVKDTNHTENYAQWSGVQHSHHLKLFLFFAPTFPFLSTKRELNACPGVGIFFTCL